MASRPIHIADYRAAVADGTIPGALRAGRTVFEFPPVESLNARGARLTWQIRVALEGGAFTEEVLAPGHPGEGLVGVITTTARQVSAAGAPGKARAGGKPTRVTRGKNLGRANATNPATQALRDALGRYNKQRRRADARAARGGPPGAKAPPPGAQPPPMLVKKIGETRGATLTPETFAAGVTVQRKLNGVRLVAYLGGGGVRVYSRTKGGYPGLAHIRAELLPALAAPPPVPDALLGPAGGLPALRPLYAGAPVYLDGELYLHGKPLRWISGQARRADDERSLEFHVFDCFFPGPKAAGHDMPSAGRQAYLDLFFAAAAPMPHVRRVENFPAADSGAVLALRDRFLREGYEGAIARKDPGGYRYGTNNYHSANLVKVKPVFDSEFAVVGYTEGAKGKDVGAVIWVCEVDPAHAVEGAPRTFSVVPNMSYAERYRLFRCLGEAVPNRPAAVAAGGPPVLTRFARDFRGRPLTVRYPGRSTKTGKPVQAKALAFRTYEGGPENDPVRRLLEECR